MKTLEKRADNLDLTDIGMTKISVVAFILFAITASSEILNIVLSIYWGWYLAAALLLGFRPFMHFWGTPKKKKRR
jgi:hypothetical protein